MRRIIAAVLFTLGVTLAAPHAQMMQAIVNDVNHAAPPATPCSPNGCSGDLATAGGGLTLFGCWSTWACTGAGAAANVKLYAYSCTGGSPSTGDVLATTGTGAPNTTAMDTACSGHTINITKIYNQGTASSWDMGELGPLPYTASAVNGHPSFDAGGGGFQLRTANTNALGALPVSMSGVFRYANGAAAQLILYADATSPLRFDTGFSSPNILPILFNGTALTSTVGGVSSDYFVSNGAVISTSSCTIDVDGTSTSGGCGTDLHTSAAKAGFNSNGTSSAHFTEFLLVKGDFSANIASLRASQCTRWRAASC